MKNKLILIVFLLIPINAHAADKYYGAPKGGYAVLAENPLWFSAINSGDIDFHETYPLPKTTEHMKVVNAGLWLANNGKEISVLVYSFEINITKPFGNRVYTRAILPNPNNPDGPFIYEGTLKPEEGSSRTNHNPVIGIGIGKEYKFVYEVYKDKKRTKLLEVIEQQFVSPVGNESGCVEVEEEYKKHYFSEIVDENNNPIPLEKVVVACSK